MKEKIILSSAIMLVIAILISIGAALFGSDPETVMRSAGVSYTLGLGSVGLWAIGFIYPKGKSNE